MHADRNKMNKKEFYKRKQTILSLVSAGLYVPMKEKELAIVMQVSGEDRQEFKRALDELLLEKKLQITKRGKYVLAEAEKAESEKNATEKKVTDKKVLDKKKLNSEIPEGETGVFISHPKGFGFIEVDGLKEDYYVPESMVNGAFHNDTVQFELLPGQRGKRQEVRVVRILKRGTEKIVGTFQKNKNYGFVIPDNRKIAEDIFVSAERSKGAVSGHKVVVEITDYGKAGKKPEGIVKEILGHVDDPGVDIISIVKGFELPTEFGEKVDNQTNRIPDEVLKADMEGRLDIRDLQMVTIDGETAKDLDDAVSLEKQGDNYVLGVHIADVTNYVQENSALDREALKRGTSVYLVDRVIPMLPHRLSNGICSLNEGVDRLALSCIMTIDPQGNLVDSKIAETVINVDRRMNYSDVAKILSTDEAEEVEALRKEYEAFVPMFEEMKRLADILREKRRKRGSIDFDFPETEILLDKEGKPLEIKAYDRNIATKIIEDFILIANETVAQYFFWLEIPFVYRTHDNPDAEKVRALGTFITNFGYSLKLTGEEVHPKELQKLLARIEGTDEDTLISRLVLRSMKQARYSPECTGHFGLACKYYCHFTSPIRRYPDLQIHRIIKEYLRGRMKKERMEHYREILDEVCKHSSAMERRADEAERETDKLKKAEYMQDYVGQIFQGVISGVTGFGLYVELPNTVEGLVHISKIPGDYFYYNEDAYELVGQSTGKKYKLGERIEVAVVSVDKNAKTIDFGIPQDYELES